MGEPNPDHEGIWGRSLAVGCIGVVAFGFQNMKKDRSKVLGVV
jgi:hypothetical protein